MYALSLIFRALNNPATKAVYPVVKHGVLSFRNRALWLGKLDMQSTALLDLNKHFLVGLTVAEFCHAVKLLDNRFCRNPVEVNHLAGLGVKRSFVAVGDVEDIVLQVLSNDKPSSAFFLAFDTAKL